MKYKAPFHAKTRQTPAAHNEAISVATDKMLPTVQYPTMTNVTKKNKEENFFTGEVMGVSSSVTLSGK